MIRRTTLIVFALLMLTVVVTLAGCDKVKSPTGPDLIGAPVISSFSISPASGPAGTAATLTWAVTGISSRVSITANAGVNPGTGFATSGSTMVNPAVSTTYTLTATNPSSGDSVTATASFTVK